jgi:hypothetical protein
MAFKRVILPKEFASKHDLSRDMAGLGFLITAEAAMNPNIENTLIAVSIEGLNGDYRSLSLLVSWLSIHHQAINADRLVKMLIQLRPNKKLLCFWSAAAKHVLKDLRFKKMQKLYKGSRLEITNKDATDFQIKRVGEDPRFEKTNLRVPANLLRNRPQDIVVPAALAKTHLAYRYRIVIGPTYRADQWALLEKVKEISPSELARQSYSSFGSAWQAKQDFDLLNENFQFI